MDDNISDGWEFFSGSIFQSNRRHTIKKKLVLVGNQPTDFNLLIIQTIHSIKKNSIVKRKGPKE
jgi:hypothetical protein